MEDTSRKTKIDKIEETDDSLTGRGGLAFFVRYLNNIGIFSVLTGYFGDLRKSRKGLPIGDLFKQIFSDYNGFWGGPRKPPKEADIIRLCSQLS